MKARDVMTQPVLSVEAGMPVASAIELMLEKKISGLPVVDDAGRLVGIVSEGDFLRRAETGTQRKRPRWLEFLMGPGRLADQYVKTHGRKVSDVMTTGVRTVSEDAPIEDVVGAMERYRVKRVPVLRDGKPVGLITRANLLRMLAGVAHELVPFSADDNTIRDRIVQEIKNQSWAPQTSVDVIVRGGVATLSGYVLDDRQREALKVLAANSPGVKDVRDRLVWVEPVSGMAVTAEQLQDDSPKS
jgi:CBS domain-containing protein